MGAWLQFPAGVWQDVDVIEAMVAGGASLVVVLLSALLARSGRKHQRELTTLDLDILARLDKYERC